MVYHHALVRVLIIRKRYTRHILIWSVVSIWVTMLGVESCMFRSYLIGIHSTVILIIPYVSWLRIRVDGLPVLALAAEKETHEIAEVYSRQSTRYYYCH